MRRRPARRVRFNSADEGPQITTPGEALEPLGVEGDGHAEMAVSGGGAGAIARHAARGAVVLAGRTVLVQVLQVVSSLVTARLISPSSYGVFAMALTMV